MKELPKISIIDAVSTDLHQSLDDLFGIIKKQQNDIEKLTVVLANNKLLNKN